MHMTSHLSITTNPKHANSLDTVSLSHAPNNCFKLFSRHIFVYSDHQLQTNKHFRKCNTQPNN